MRENLIPEVFDPVEGRYIKASTYFSEVDDRKRDAIHSRRRELLRAKRQGNKLWVCALCQEPIYIAGGLGRTKRRAHFKHFIDTPRCPYQTRRKFDQETIRKIKYNGAKESSLHHDIKDALSSLLNDDPSTADLAVEKTFFHQDGGREWRRPDIAATWRDLKIVFEIQISSDFVDVIIGREDFYREQGVFILWIFNKLDPDQYTVRDIYVGSQKNCFLFNERVREISLQSGVLTLECRYKKPVLIEGKIVDEWHTSDVTLEDLTFDPERMQAFLFDYDTAEKDLLRPQLLTEFQTYWCLNRSEAEFEEMDYWNRRFEEKFSKLFDIQPGWTRSKVTNVISALYSLQLGRPVNYDQNLFALVDTMLHYRKPFTFVILWAIEVFGHKDAFKDRRAFQKKLALYKKAKEERIWDFRREKKYDLLLGALFPELIEPLAKDTGW